MGTVVKRLLAYNTGPLDSLPVELNANQQAQQSQWVRSMEPQTRGLLKGEGVPIGGTGLTLRAGWQVFLSPKTLQWSHQLTKFYFLPSLTVLGSPNQSQQG